MPFIDDGAKLLLVVVEADDDDDDAGGLAQTFLGLRRTAAPLLSPSSCMSDGVDDNEIIKFLSSWVTRSG